MAYNKDLEHADERNMILTALKGVVVLAGDIEIDNDDENGHFSITQEYYWNGEHRTRVIRGQLLVTSVEETK